MNDLTIACADIGSVKENHFGWAISSSETDEKGTDIRVFADRVAEALAGDGRVALGFECPLWIPVPGAPSELGKARPDEGRPWSAGAGALSLTTGLAQVAWILEHIRKNAHNAHDIEAYLDWDRFQQSRRGLFLWEAFVSGSGKAGSHEEDAAAAVSEFRQALPDVEARNALSPKTPTRSLIGAALLWAEWSKHPQLLHTPCIVIRCE